MRHRVLSLSLLSAATFASALLLASDSLASKAGSTVPRAGVHATAVFYGGRVVPMTSPSDVYEAIALTGNRILALGTNAEILALEGPDTQRTNLQGHALYPGFIDPHTHLMMYASWSWQGFTFGSIQQFAFENGVTSAAEMCCHPWLLNDLISYASSGALHLRLFPFLVYNDHCHLGVELGTWYEQYPPFAELASRLCIGGVKIYAEGSICSDRGIVPVFSPALLCNFPLNPSPDFRANELSLSREELAAAIRRAQEKGYPVAIHAIGDVGVETSLRAIIDALAGRPNTLRHAVMHNRFVRDDFLDLFAQYGITAMVEHASPCWWTMWIPIVGEKNGEFFGRQRDLVETGAHVTSDSDWPCLGQQALGPLQLLPVMMDVGELDLLREYEPCSACPIDQTLSAWQGLRMMTVEAAYALHIEDELGSLEPGKLADLVVLSADPMTAAPEQLGQIKVLMTMVDGKIEWQRDGFLAQDSASALGATPVGGSAVGVPAQPDWGTVEHKTLYAEPLPAVANLFGSSGQLPVSQGTHWGLAGSDVKGLKLSYSASGLFVRLETRSTAIGGSYLYNIHFWPPGGAYGPLMISLAPAGGATGASMLYRGAWRDVASAVRLVETGDTYLVAFLPSERLPSGEMLEETAGWGVILLATYVLPDGSWEQYELASTPSD